MQLSRVSFFQRCFGSFLCGFPNNSNLEPRLDEFEAGVPVVQIHQRKALGDWEDEDDYPVPAVPVRISSTSMTLLKGFLAAFVKGMLTTLKV